MTGQGCNPGRCDPDARARGQQLTSPFSRSVPTLKPLFRTVGVGTLVTRDNTKMHEEQSIPPCPPPHHTTFSHLPRAPQCTRTRRAGWGERGVHAGGAQTGSPSSAQRRDPAARGPRCSVSSFQARRSRLQPGGAFESPASLHPGPPALVHLLLSSGSMNRSPLPSVSPPPKSVLSGSGTTFRKCKSDHAARVEEGPGPLPGPSMASVI